MIWTIIWLNAGMALMYFNKWFKLRGYERNAKISKSLGITVLAVLLINMLWM